MLKNPPLLQKGDKVGVMSPSRVIEELQVERAFEVLQEWHLSVRQSQHLFARHGYFAGSDDQRIEDFQDMINDHELKAIFCARGGYGMTRIIDQIDLTPLLTHPKWFVGYSDITALHLALYKTGLQSIHGLMPAQFGDVGVEASLASLHSLLFEGAVNYEIHSHEMNRNGAVEAEILGGNLSLVAESLGTPTEIDTQNKILFLEEIDEYLYKIDRMLVQLKRAGKLQNLAGLIIGDFSKMKDTGMPFGKSIHELIEDHVKGYSFPVVYNFPVGHEPKNLAIPSGRKMQLIVKEEKVLLSCTT